MKQLTILVLTMALAACAGTPRMDAPVNTEWEARRQLLESLSQWEFTGSINVRDANEAQSSRIRWRQQDEAYRINLWGTFNVGATEINGRPGEVRIEQQGEEPIITESPEEMLYQQIGYELPVTELNYWIKGIPAPGASHALNFADNQQLLSFEQDGWRIDYLGYTNFGQETLPTRIRIQKDPLRLDLIRLSWTLPAAQIE
ncbi:MAG: lipoprotein insertase outer membrane protein LolB [Pseudohongiella sp.]|nr:lipoprotein insertase outer membrane protein LolB [Pseudohongiella sp.]MDO9521383.1 lipoprotein insertase outer membrane protein LolB [Pseudohongiella sp.]MDP2125849.1 lipoprotein insertase outer membrane protein LolB [Pseudohongiella sp.]